MADHISDIDRQAAEWVAMADAAASSPALKLELDNWLAEDIRHRGAYLRAQTMMAHVEQHGFALRARFNTQWKAQPFLTRRWALAGGIPAAAALVAVYGALEPAKQTAADYATQVGEKRLVQLADGSSVMLNTASKLAVRYSADKRGVALESGEAVFDVAKDAARPFEVMSRGVSIRAVGTRFAVLSLVDHPLEVRVLQGIVRVEQGGRDAAVFLRPNMRAVVRPGSRIEVVVESPEDIAQDLAWREGHIVFRHRTVASAVQEFSRYNKLAITIDDPSVAGQTVTGSYAANDPIGFAKAVALAFNLDVIVNGGDVRLTRKPH